MRLVSIALASGLIVAAGSAYAGTIVGSFDGNCDGFSLTTKADGSAFGVETGCLSGPIAGRWITKFKKGAGGAGAATVENHLPGDQFEINTTFHTWTVFLPDGSLLQAGTWTPTPQSRSNRGLPMTGSVAKARK